MKEYGLFYIRNSKDILKLQEEIPELTSKKNSDVKIQKQDILVLKNSILYQLIKNHLDTNIYSYIYNERVEYSPDEFKNAKLFNCAGAVINDWGYEKGTKYKVIAGCDDSNCTKIKTQTSILHMDTKKLGHKDFCMLLSFEFVVSKRFKDMILENQLTGCAFKPVIHLKNDIPSEDVFQLTVTNILPEVSPELEREIIKCKNCGTEIYLQKGWQFVYSESVLSKICDFNITREYYSLVYPFRDLIISQKAYQLFKKHKIKGVSCAPVKLV